MELKGVLFDGRRLREHHRWTGELQELLQGLYRYGIRVADIGVTGLNELKQQGLLPEQCLLIADCKETTKNVQEKNLAVLGYEDENTSSHLTGIPMVVEGFEEVDFYFLERVYQRFHGLPWTVLETKRCILREITTDDLNRLYEIYAQPQITEYMENLYEDPRKEEEYTRDYIKNMYGFFGYGVWLVVEKEQGEIIGRAGLNHLELDGGFHLELGYVIALERQNKGYATEVCEAVLDFARHALAAREVTCLIEPGNTASVHLAKKLGFVWKEERLIGEKRMQRYVKLFSSSQSGQI